MRGPHRRQVLGTLGALALAGCEGDESTTAEPEGVAIIGGGMAGVATAWLLDGAERVDLFEARGAIGGNVRGVDVDGVIIDLGAQYFHPGV